MGCKQMADNFFQDMFKTVSGQKVNLKPMGQVYMGLGAYDYAYHLGPIPMYFKLDIVQVAKMGEGVHLVKTPIPGKKGEHISKMGVKTRQFAIGVILSGTREHYKASNYSPSGAVLKGSVKNPHAILGMIRLFMDSFIPIVFKFGNIHTGMAIIADTDTMMLPGQPNDIAVRIDLLEYFRIPLFSSPIGQHLFNFNFTSPFGGN